MAADPADAPLGAGSPAWGEPDYLQAAEFCPGGAGELVLGYGRAVKYEGRFRYALDGAGRLRLALEGAAEGVIGPARVLGFEVTEGLFPIRLSPTRTRPARRRLQFSVDPFPSRGRAGPCRSTTSSGDGRGHRRRSRPRRQSGSGGV